MNILKKWLSAVTSRTRVNREALVEVERVRALPLEAVKPHALELIGDRRRFRSVVEPRSPNPLIEALGPVLQEFFSRFESVEEINGDFKVSRRVVSPSTVRPGFIKIGTDFEHSELVTQTGDDRVFIVTDAEHVIRGMPTIYHNIYLLD